MELIDVAEARRRVLAAVAALESEEVALSEALGRVLREDVRSAEDLPPFDSSAMDGFALVAGTARGVPGGGEARAGRPAGRPPGPGGGGRGSAGAPGPPGGAPGVPRARAGGR